MQCLRWAYVLVKISHSAKGTKTHLSFAPQTLQEEKKNIFPQVCLSIALFQHCFSSLFFFIKMLRLQRLCGKSRSGASVPLCIKLQGAVVCRGPQQPTSETADVSPKDSPKRLPALDQQPCCPLESENVNTENPQQPLDDASFGEYLIVAFSGI